MTPRRSIVPVFVPHLGCPNQCVFCNQRKIAGQARPATAQDVADALTRAAAFLPPGAELALYGGSFTAIAAESQQALLDAAAPWLKSGFLSSIRVSTRPDCVDEQTLARLWKGGVRTVELGVQSMDEEVLRLSGRGHTAQDAERAAKMVKAAGFSLILQMMTGLPGDTPARSMDTARRLAALGPDGVRIYPTVVLRDTPLYDRWKSGAYRAQSVEEAVALCAELLPLFGKSGIPVIRLGLNPTEELSGGEAVAGAYHPALGQLVRARIYLKKARALLSGGARPAALGVHRGEVSTMVGQHRENLETLRREFALPHLRVRAADVPRGEIVLLFTSE